MNGILNTRPGAKPSVSCIYCVSIFYTIIMMCNVEYWAGFRSNDRGFI